MQRLLVLTLLLTFGQIAQGTSCEPGMLQTPFTPRLDYWWSRTRFKVTETVEQFLKSGADEVFSSRAKNASVVEQLGLVVGHVRKHVDYAQTCAIHPPLNFEDVLARKQGACVQINLLAAAVIARAGFRARIAYRLSKEGWGHVWVEVGEGERTLVVDATRDGFVASLVDLRKASPPPDAFESRWYLHPDRVLRDVQ